MNTVVVVTAIVIVVVVVVVTAIVIVVVVVTAIVIVVVVIIATITCSVLRKVHSLFQNEFSRKCQPVFSLSISSIFLFPYGHPVTA